MSLSYELDFEGMAQAISAAVVASRVMETSSVGRPTSGFGSVTGLVSSEVSYFLRGISVARDALADAALSAGKLLQDATAEAITLDTAIAESLAVGFALPPDVARRNE